jgi:hypothetical protein
VRDSFDSERRVGQVCLYIATVSAVLGIISGILHAFLGLEIMSWFLLAIVTFFITFLIGWAVSRYSEATEPQKKE